MHIVPQVGSSSFAFEMARLPEETFSFILCRNVVFTYFAEEEQVAVSKTIHACLEPGGLLVLGKHEQVPASICGFRKPLPQLPVYHRV